MPDDALKEAAATGDPPAKSRLRLRLATQEFFFLLQRIDRLDEKLSSEIRAQGERIDRLDEKLSSEIRAQGERIDRLDEKLSSEIKALDERLSGEIKNLDGKINALNEKINSKFNSLTFWAVGIFVTIIAGFIGLALR